MKTVIHYKNDPYLGITETWIYEQIKNLKRYKPIVYCHSTQNLDIYPVSQIRSLGSRRKITTIRGFFDQVWNRFLRFYILSIYFLLKDKPNLVHAHYGISGYHFLLFKKIFKIPMITTFYGYDLSIPSRYPVWRKRYKKLFAQGDLFLVEGYHMKNCLIALGCPENKILIQHLGINLDMIKFLPRIVKKEEEIRILISASFREKKGIPYAIKAFAKVKTNNPGLRIKLTIIGGSDGSCESEKEKKTILKEIEECGLDDSIDLLGYQSYPVLINEIYKYHIFLAPSVSALNGDTEGGAPVSIIEASASGMPILSTKHCDIPEVVLDGQSGYLVPERDIDALAERLEHLVLNPCIWEEMGFKGRRHIESKYNVKIQVQTLEEIYDAISGVC